MIDKDHINIPGDSREGSDWRWLLYTGVALVSLLLAYSAGVANLINRWVTQVEYSHGFFMPLLTLYFIWQLRGKIAAQSPRPSLCGVVLILVAGVLLVVGEISAIFILIHYSLLIVLCGLVLALAGWTVLRIMLVPILLLAFAIPLPYFIDASLSWQLQLLSSELGVWVIRLFNIPVFLEGNVIDLGIYKLQVVEACSGLRYLYPMVGLGFYLAYMYQAPFWQRTLVFLSTIPITVFVNSFRIGVTGILVKYWGIGMAEGFLHDFEGWVIFLVAALMLFLEMWLLTFTRTPRPRLRHIFGVEAVPLPEKSVWDLSKPPSRVFTSSVSLLLVAAVLVTVVGGRKELVAERDAFSRFPMHVGEWVATEGSLDPIAIDKLGLDDYFIADYRDGAGNPLNFYIAYYATQRKGVSPHSPRVCIPGGGWLITELSTVELDAGDGTQIPVNRAIIERAGQRQLVYYWFQQRGRSIASEYWMKWYLLVDSLMRNRTDGALVRVVMPIGSDTGPAVADQKVRQYISAIYPKLRDYVPD